jgi:hypothetical protein
MKSVRIPTCAACRIAPVAPSVTDSTGTHPDPSDVSFSSIRSTTLVPTVSVTSFIPIGFPAGSRFGFAHLSYVPA